MFFKALSRKTIIACFNADAFGKTRGPTGCQLRVNEQLGVRVFLPMAGSIRWKEKTSAIINCDGAADTHLAAVVKSPCTSDEISVPAYLLISEPHIVASSESTLNYSVRSLLTQCLEGLTEH